MPDYLALPNNIRSTIGSGVSLSGKAPHTNLVFKRKLAHKIVDLCGN